MVEKWPNPNNRVVAPVVAFTQLPIVQASGEHASINTAGELQDAGKQGFTVDRHRRRLDQGDARMIFHQAYHLDQRAAFHDAVGIQVDHVAIMATPARAKIFQIALEQMRLPAEKTAYVGDQFVADVLGSKSVGMMSIWLQSNPPKPCPDASKVDWCITQIEDLLELKALPRSS